MSEEASAGTSLLRVLAWLLAIIIGGIGWLAASLSPELWHLAIGIPLIFLASALVRAVQ